MPGARMLDGSALEAHCQMLTAQAPDVYAHLRHPGLPEDEIRSQFAAAGVRPSDEVIRWWSFWRRAPESERKSLGFNLEVLPECAFVTVQQSVEAHAFNRRLAHENASPAGRRTRCGIPSGSRSIGTTTVSSPLTAAGPPTSPRRSCS